MQVFVLQHKSEHSDEPKLLGVFDCRASAEAAIKAYQSLPGFRDEPDGYSIDCYELNSLHWTEGFATPEKNRKSDQLADQ